MLELISNDVHTYVPYINMHCDRKPMEFIPYNLFLKFINSFHLSKFTVNKIYSGKIIITVSN